MRVVRTNFDREESRRDRRYALPYLMVVIDGREYTSNNWSLGGFHLTAELPGEIGSLVSGTMHIESSDGFAFTAQLVRREEETGTVAFHFRDMTPLDMTKLDRALARRLVSRRRP